jgi:hypothetical protein
MVYALQTLSDKPYMGSVTSGPNAEDTIAMGEILFGGRAAIEATPASLSLINVNSPLRFDDRMLSALVAYAKANQATIITPFLLMGAMSPVSIPATLASRWPRRSPASPSRSSSAPAARSSSAPSSRTPTCSPARRRSGRPSQPSGCCAPGRSRAPSACPGARAAA